MNILIIIIPTLGYGGTERITSVIANKLVSNGYNIHILSLSNGLSPTFHINIHSLGYESKSSTFSNYYISKSLTKFNRKYSIDCLINVDIVLSYYSMISSLFYKCNIISWEHFHYYINNEDFIQKTRRNFSRFLIKFLSSKLITLSKKDMEQYISNGYSKYNTYFINNPYTLNDCKISTIESKIILGIGRLTKQKGFDLLIKSWNIINKESPNWELHIVGDGDEKENLFNMIKKYHLEDSVFIHGFKANVKSYFENSSIYCSTSRFERFPLVLLEAKQHGFPIVSFDYNCGPSDIINDSIDGFIIENENIQEFSKKLNLLIKDISLRKKFSENAWKEDKFHLNNIIKEWVRILK